MKVTIITAGYNSKKHIAPFFESVLRTQGVEYEIIAVDDGSTDGSAEIFNNYSTHKQVTINILPNNKGGSAARNTAAYAGTGEYIIYFDIDARIQPDTVRQLLAPLEHDDSIGMTQAVLLNADGTIESSGHFLTPFGFPYNVATNYKNKEKYVPTLGTRVAFAVRRKLFEQIGGYDEDYKIYGEDTDITWRIWLTGHRVLTMPDIQVVHLKQSSLNTQTNFRLYYEGCKNLMSSLLKNLPWYLLVWMIPLHTLIWLLISIKLAFEGKKDMSLWIYKGLWWNITHIKSTIRKRKKNQTHTMPAGVLFGPLTGTEIIKKGFAWLRGF